jgi:hypothetical protein
MPAITPNAIAAVVLLLASQTTVLAGDIRSHGVEVQALAAKEIVDGTDATMKPVSVRSIEVPKDDASIHVVSTKVNWVSSISFRSPDGKRCALTDVTVGSDAFNIVPEGGTIHVHPQMTGQVTNLNVSVSGSREIRTFVLEAGTEKVDTRTEVIVDCPQG